MTTISKALSALSNAVANITLKIAQAIKATWAKGGDMREKARAIGQEAEIL
jgi:hypothetical protein